LVSSYERSQQTNERHVLPQVGDSSIISELLPRTGSCVGSSGDKDSVRAANDDIRRVQTDRSSACDGPPPKGRC
jgi:hypothetical protein